MDLRGDRQRVVDRPAARAPLLLGDEQRGHERLEHAAAPAGDDPEVLVWIGALEDVDAEVRRAEADRLGLVPAPVAGLGERPPGPEVLLGRQLAGRDPDIARDPALAHDRVVAARRRPGARGVVEGDPVDLGPVVEAEMHAVERELRRARTARERCWRRPACRSRASRCRPTTGSARQWSPVGGHTVSTSPVVWSYQLKYWPLGWCRSIVSSDPSVWSSRATASS